MENRKINIGRLAEILSAIMSCYTCPVGGICDSFDACTPAIKYWLTENPEEDAKAEKDECRPKVFYVSHPFTGDESTNRRKARDVTAMLKDHHPQYIFINPLDAMRYTTGLPYEESIKQCLELLQICDGIIMTSDWKNSVGCNKEFMAASGCGMEITYLDDWGISL